MEAREMLKQQVRLIRETVEDKTQNIPCSKSNQFAKQILRVLSICSVLGIADGKMLFDFSFLELPFVKALSCWYAVSPMMIAATVGLLVTLMFVIFMIPRQVEESEPDPENAHSPEHAESSGHADVPVEPSQEPQPSRYPMSERALGLKFPSVFDDSTYRHEGVLIWLCHRCQLRINRDNKPILNMMRMNELRGMMNMCTDGLSQDQNEHLKESLLAISDLSEDEGSPTHGNSEQAVKTEILQAFQAYQVGMGLYGHLRRPARSNDDSGEEPEETAEQRYFRYVRANYDDVSDPAEWMEIHGIEMSGDELEDSFEESREARRRRYLFSERHEVSDGEQWDRWFEEVMQENELIARGEMDNDT
eukprot:s4161_g5.t1